MKATSKKDTPEAKAALETLRALEVADEMDDYHSEVAGTLTEDECRRADSIINMLLDEGVSLKIIPETVMAQWPEADFDIVLERLKLLADYLDRPTEATEVVN